MRKAATKHYIKFSLIYDRNELIYLISFIILPIFYVILIYILYVYILIITFLKERIYLVYFLIFLMCFKY